MNPQTQQGLTLIEVLVALAIFAIVSMAVLSMFPAIFKLNSQTRADQAVTISAKRFMDQMRSVLYAKDISGQYSNFKKTKMELEAAGKMPEVLSSDLNGYTCTSALETIMSDSAGDPLIRQVTLTCVKTGYPTQTFSLDFGRPSS